MEVMYMVRRIFTCLFLLVFVSVSCTTVLAEGIMGEALEEPGTDSFLSQPFEKRFGEDAIVEMDENQNPVSVNGYPFRTVTASFNVRGLENKFSAETDFVDYPFWQPATKYNGSLANMSLIMALCAARDKPHGKALETFDPSQNVEAYLLEAGFSDIRKDDYSKETSIYTISTAIGARRMEHGGEEPFTLIAVGVCGAGYKNEWQSNISAGTSALQLADSPHPLRRRFLPCVGFPARCLSGGRLAGPACPYPMHGAVQHQPDALCPGRKRICLQVVPLRAYRGHTISLFRSS